MRESFVRGVRLGIPYAVVGFVLSMSFGVVARQAGFSASRRSPLPRSCSPARPSSPRSPFAASGGTLFAAVAAAAMMNGRFLAMGIALAPSLPGGPLKRGLQGQTVVDASWALANNGDGTFDRWLLFGTTAPQYVTWVLGTVMGAYGGDLLGDPTGSASTRCSRPSSSPWCWPSCDPRSRVVALIGALIALALVPFAPPGVPCWPPRRPRCSACRSEAR